MYKDKTKMYENQRARWVKRKAEAVAYLGSKCTDCNHEYHPNVFDFHHRPGVEKLYMWDRLRLRAWSSIKAELDKCDLLCANCHRMRHVSG